MPITDETLRDLMVNADHELRLVAELDGTPLTYVNAPGAEGINVNGIVATSDGRYLIIASATRTRSFGSTSSPGRSSL